MRKLLTILLAGGLSLAPAAMAAPAKTHARKAGHKKGHRPTNKLRRRAQSAKRNNKVSIPKNRKLV